MANENTIKLLREDKGKLEHDLLEKIIEFEKKHNIHVSYISLHDGIKDGIRCTINLSTMVEIE